MPQSVAASTTAKWKVITGAAQCGVQGVCSQGSEEPQQGADYATLLSVAQATERLGFDAFFRSDHYLTIGGSGLPGPTDAWITLAGLACETSRIRLGTLVSPVTFRRPGPLAITVAQVDQMSGGRAELGLGTAGDPVVGFKLAQPIFFGSAQGRAAAVGWRDVNQRLGPQ